MKQNIFKTFTTTKDNNLAYHVTNDKNQVDTARNNLSIKHNFDINNLKYMNQVHGNYVQIVNKEQNIYECDALITNIKNTPLLVMVADCIPILFYDEVLDVVAVAHAGRNGTFKNISSNVIKSMKENFSCKAKNIKVELGASIQKCCYEVSVEMTNIVCQNFGDEFVQNRNIDLQGINKKQLLEIGVLEKNITISTICTKCSAEDYYSYRKDKNCGRFAGLIMIN